MFNGDTNEYNINIILNNLSMWWKNSVTIGGLVRLFYLCMRCKGGEGIAQCLSGSPWMGIHKTSYANS